MADPRPSSVGADRTVRYDAPALPNTAAPAARVGGRRRTGRRVARTHYCLLAAILVLSAYVHLWNPAGFPDIFFDEGIYMRRAMHVIETGDPQESYFYDHPYFGQIVLAGFAKLAGFPGTVQQSLEASYLAPRILTGLFAVLDTFLVYKISEERFGRRTAVIAGVLFASMPVTWMFRRILLDTILMPFLLSSILLALYSGGRRRPGALVAGSAVLLGLAIFTKMTAVVMIPLVAYVIFSRHGTARLARWLAPVLAIPLAWPASAAVRQQLDLWFGDVLWQAGRDSMQFWQATGLLLVIDPVLAGLGLAGLVLAVLYRNVLLVLWIAPFLVFAGTVGFFQYFHYVLILPGVCVAAAWMLHACIARTRPGLQRYAYVGTVLALASYGTAASADIISADLTGPQFDAMQYTIDTFDDAEYTLLASPVYTWILSDIHGRDNVFADYAGVLFYEPETERTYLIVDPHFVLDQSRGSRISEVLQNSTSVVTFSGTPGGAFPYEHLTGEGLHIDIRTGGKAGRP